MTSHYAGTVYKWESEKRTEAPRNTEGREWGGEGGVPSRVQGGTQGRKRTLTPTFRIFTQSKHFFTPKFHRGRSPSSSWSFLSKFHPIRSRNGEVIIQKNHLQPTHIWQRQIWHFCCIYLVTFTSTIITKHTYTFYVYIVPVTQLKWLWIFSTPIGV